MDFGDLDHHVDVTQDEDEVSDVVDDSEDDKAVCELQVMLFSDSFMECPPDPIRVTKLTQRTRPLALRAVVALSWLGEERLFHLLLSRTSEMLKLLVPEQSAELAQRACACMWPGLVLLIRDRVPTHDLEILRLTQCWCETVEALEWLYPNGEGIGVELAVKNVLRGCSEAVVRWALRWGGIGPLDQESEELPLLKLADYCLRNADRCRWVLRARPEAKRTLTADILLFAQINAPMARLDCVRLLREFGYAVSDAAKRKCVEEGLNEHLCALLSCGYLSSVPPQLERMSCRDRWLRWTPVTHGLIKDFEITERVMTALCCFRVYCPRLPKDLKGLILTLAMDD